MKVRLQSTLSFNHGKTNESQQNYVKNHSVKS